MLDLIALFSLNDSVGTLVYSLQSARVSPESLSFLLSLTFVYCLACLCPLISTINQVLVMFEQMARPGLRLAHC